VGRELKIREAAVIKEKTGLEIEMFVHGAMCMSYSGHCSMSTYVANRDSNRGGCIQNCRYRYTLNDGATELQHSYLLSSKDLCGIKLLPDIISAGIDSIKIEGRMKSNLYIATTVRAYANAITDVGNNSVDLGKWQTELEKVPYRGYTEANLKADAGEESVYAQSREIGKEYKMAGTVIDVDTVKNRFAFQVKNKLHVGDSIELMPFQGEIINLTIQSLEDLEGQEMNVAQPHNVIWLPLLKGIKKSNVARIKAS
jgi:putative protease